MDLALHGSVLSGGRQHDRCRVLVARGRVRALEFEVAPRPGDLVVADGWIAPGLVDLHVHGAAGVDVASAEDPAEAVATMARALAGMGVTAFCPSLVSAPAPAYERLVPAFRPGPHPGGAESLGANLEGPFLNPLRRGIHEPGALRNPSTDEVEAWLRLGPPSLVTLAPELPGGLNAVRRLAAAGVTVSLGHSDADAAATRAALDAGASHATHLFNAMPPLHHREPGLAGALLASDASLEVIADGVHLDPLVVQVVVRAAGPGRVALITDGLAPTGLPPGPGRLGGQEVISDGRSVRRADGTLAGTALPLADCLRNLAAWCPWLSPAEVVRMATSTPAGVLGPRVAARKGAIAPGYDADLVLLDRDWRVRAAYVRGVPVGTPA